MNWLGNVTHRLKKKNRKKMKEALKIYSSNMIMLNAIAVGQDDSWQTKAAL